MRAVHDGLFFLALGLAAQTSGPVGLSRGNLLEIENTAGTGELSIRTAANHVYRFAFDPATYFERENRRSSADGLRKGEIIEIVADQKPGVRLCYARTIHVIERTVPRRPSLRAGAIRPWSIPSDTIVPRGNLTFSGVVTRIDPDRILLRTRTDGVKSILIRQDTRYLEDGEQVEPSTLRPNQRVFVRGSRNLDDDVEAYQVIWGSILDPR